MNAKDIMTTTGHDMPKSEPISGETSIKDTEAFIANEMEKTEKGDESIYTIGHSNHPIGDFINLLKRHGITATADVRSSPFNRHYPQFNRDALAGALHREGIAYVFLGEELGARPNDPDCYDNGSANFDKMAERPLFKRGTERLLKAGWPLDA